MSGREKVLAIVVASVVGLWAGDRYVLGPMLDARRSLANERARLTTELEKGSDTVRAGAAAMRRWHAMNLSDDAASAEGAALHALRTFAEGSGLGLESLKPVRSGDRESLRRLVFSTAATGSLEQVVGFCKQIEKADIPLRIESFDLALREERGTQLRLDLRVSTLYFDDAAERARTVRGGAR